MTNRGQLSLPGISGQSPSHSIEPVSSLTDSRFVYGRGTTDSRCLDPLFERATAQSPLASHERNTNGSRRTSRPLLTSRRARKSSTRSSVGPAAGRGPQSSARNRTTSITRRSCSQSRGGGAAPGCRSAREASSTCLGSAEPRFDRFACGEFGAGCLEAVSEEPFQHVDPQSPSD